MFQVTSFVNRDPFIPLSDECGAAMRYLKVQLDRSWTFVGGQWQLSFSCNIDDAALLDAPDDDCVDAMSLLADDLVFDRRWSFVAGIWSLDHAQCPAFHVCPHQPTEPEQKPMEKAL